MVGESGGERRNSLFSLARYGFIALVRRFVNDKPFVGVPRVSTIKAMLA